MQLKSVRESFIPFIKKYRLLLSAILIFILFFVALIVLYATPQQPTSTQNQTGITTKSTENVSVSPANVPPSSPYPSGEGMSMDSDEVGMVMWPGNNFSPNDLGTNNYTTTTLTDGSVQYSYPSDTPSRSNIVIVKNGVNVFERHTMYNVKMGAPPANKADHPDYTAIGSLFWGANAVTYIYLSKGFAYVGNPSTNIVYEQMIFQPGTINQFMLYDTDITGTLKSY
jgi:cytoskeletal protein RodZ